MTAAPHKTHSLYFSPQNTFCPSSLGLTMVLYQCRPTFYNLEWVYKKIICFAVQVRVVLYIFYWPLKSFVALGCLAVQTELYATFLFLSLLYLIESDLQICEPKAPTCCTRKMEESYQTFVKRKLVQNIEALNFELKFMIVAHASAFQGENLAHNNL